MLDETVKLLLLLNSVGFDGKISADLSNKNITLEQIDLKSDKIYDLLNFTDKRKYQFQERLLSNWCERELEKAQRENVSIVTCLDYLYPQRLFDLLDYPLVLYVKGVYPDFNRDNFVSVVGTRRASEYAKHVAYDIGCSAADNGYILVSGGATGIDTAAHSGAYDSTGVTCVIMGTGVDKVYPARNAGFFDKITENGGLVSEFPLGTSARPWHFPRRNRIISALSNKLIVVEAPHRSGAIITAKYSLELGREVWAVPGRITDYVAEGSNQLIYDGAFPYLNDACFWELVNPVKNFEQSKLNDDMCTVLSETERKIYEYVKYNGEQTVDSISSTLQMNGSDILTTITLLTVKGIIYKSGTGRYSAK